VQRRLLTLQPERLAQEAEALTPPPGPIALLQAALLDEPSASLREGGVFQKGYDAQLDELRQIDEGCGEYLAAMEVRERERTGIPTLRVGFNSVHGFFIEITQSQADKAPIDYQRRQTLKNVERYITPELKAFEDKALSAKDRALAREKGLFEDLLDKLASSVPHWQRVAKAAAYWDVLQALAQVADEQAWVRPEFISTPGIELRACRHPVVQARVEHYTPNDCVLHGKRRMQIITGPNMGGKSTFMRSVAICTLLAYMGSYVPAQRAVFGPIKQIFTRIGASDDLAGGRSTFMVEMTEAAAILNAADEQSLVLMDEIGRGTSTFDGLSIAMAIADRLVDENRSLSLFATHYFEITQLAAKRPEAVNVHLSAVESRGHIAFLHEVKDGPANKSYGLQVAKLAGLPSPALRQAEKWMQQLELHAAEQSSQIDLFAQDANQLASPSSLLHSAGQDAGERQTLQDLRASDLDALSPKQAQDLLYRLKANLGS
jgi:DNA mismatch repair protein MutS